MHALTQVAIVVIGLALLPAALLLLGSLFRFAIKASIVLVALGYFGLMGCCLYGGFTQYPIVGLMALMSLALVVGGLAFLQYTVSGQGLVKAWRLWGTDAALCILSLALGCLLIFGAIHRNRYDHDFWVIGGVAFGLLALATWLGMKAASVAETAASVASLADDEPTRPARVRYSR